MKVYKGDRRYYKFKSISFDFHYTNIDYNFIDGRTAQLIEYLVNLDKKPMKIRHFTMAYNSLQINLILI